MKRLILVLLIITLPAIVQAQEICIDTSGNRQVPACDSSGNLQTNLATITSGVLTVTEDAAETAGGKGVYSMSVRRDTAASSAGTTGDNATINTDANGALWVRESVSTTAATFAPVTVVTAATLGAAYSAVVDLPDGTKQIQLDNQTNGDVMFSLDNGTSDHYHLKAGDVLQIPLAPLGLVTTAVIQAKDGTTASTSGSIYVTSIK